MNEPNFLMESNVKPLPKSIISSHTVEITSLKSTGMIPCCRSSFIGILYNNDQIFIHGGTNEDVDLHDSYILDLETLVWSSYSIDCPYKLTLVGHAALLLNNENSNLKNLLIFGGWDGSKYIDTSYLLNLDSHCLKASYYKGWNTSNSLRFKGQLSSKSNLGNAKSWGGPKSCGSDIPSSRRDHTLTYDSSKNKIYLFGGWNAINWGFEENEFNELWTLDADWRWVSETTHGFVPPGRRGHTAIFIEENNTIIVFGGVYGYNKILGDCFSLDLEKKTWISVEFSANDDFIPRPRAWHSVSKIKDEIFYIGGMMRNQEFSNEIISFNIFTFKWKEIYIDKSPNAIFKPRCSHFSVLKENNLYIMGGLGKCETKEDLTNSEKKESNVARNVETCTFGFNQIVKIQLFELKKSKSFSESLKKEEIFLANLQSNEKQAINSSSGELSNSNSYFLQNEWDIISESEKITKLNSAENISKIMDAIKNDGSMKESKSSANFSIKKNESLFSQNKDFNFKKKENIQKNLCWNPEKFPSEDFFKEPTKKSEEFDLDVEKHFALKGITEKELPNKNEIH